MAKTKREILDYKTAWAMRKYYENHEESKEKARVYQRKRLGWGKPRPPHPRSVAKTEGKTRYFTGKECANGHIAERLVSNGRCIKCMYEWREKYWDENPEEYYLSLADKSARVKADPRQKLMHSLRIRLLRALKRNSKTGSAVRDLGCSIDYFMEYIANKFQEGMTWDNHGEWHLDHIKPLYQFDLTDREQLLEALHYTNYQPLWAIDNLRKNRYALAGRWRCI